MSKCEVRTQRAAEAGWFTSGPDGEYDTFQEVAAKKLEKRIAIYLNFPSANEAG